MIYKLENIEKTYDVYGVKTHALKDINLEITEGEIVVILGPSGSGKSTLLNLLAGIDSPSFGKIHYKDRRIDNLNYDELSTYRKENLGFIFQSYNLIPTLTAYENIELGRNLSNDPLDIKKVIKEVNIYDKRNKYPYQLSGGEMQRVAIARALVGNKKVLFLDEPTGALDEKVGKKVLKLLQQINKDYKTTMILVTHNPSIALIANTVIKLNSGKIVEVHKNKKQVDADLVGWA